MWPFIQLAACLAWFKLAQLHNLTLINPTIEQYLYFVAARHAKNHNYTHSYNNYAAATCNIVAIIILL